MCVYFFSQYVTKTVEVDSPATLKHLTKAKQRNELLSEKLAGQNERCKQLEEQIRKSDEYSCNLQHKVTQAADSPAAGSYLSLLLSGVNAQAYKPTTCSSNCLRITDVNV